MDGPVSDLTFAWSALLIEGVEVPCSVMTGVTTQGGELNAENLSVHWKNSGSEVQATEVLRTQSQMPSWAPLSLLCLFGIFLKKPNWGAGADRDWLIELQHRAGKKSVGQSIGG